MVDEYNDLLKVGKFLGGFHGGSQGKGGVSTVTWG